VRLTQVQETLSRHSSLFLWAYIYGSVARGTDDEASDVDLILVRRTQAPFFDRIREVMDLVRELVKTDLMIYTEAEQLQMLAEPGRYFIKDVFAGGLTVEGTQDRGAAVATAGGE
jgi:predicted nucleotidyltransferase